MFEIPGSIAIIAVAIAMLVVFLFVMRGIAQLYQKVPPNGALVVYGGRRGDRGYEIIKGGGTIVLPFFEATKVMSLELMPLEIKSLESNSLAGVKISVDAVAQVKIGGTDVLMATAAEQLLSKDAGSIQDIAVQSLTGHLRGIIAQMTVEDIYKEREKFQANVAETAKSEMNKMGLEIVSFAVKEITDSHGYMEALGKPQIAKVLRDAAVAEAEAKQTERERVAVANQAAREKELAAEIAIADATRTRDVQVAQFKATSQTEQAKADKAYELQSADINQQLATRNGAVNIETQKQAALAAEQAIKVAQNQQQADVVVPAQAKREQTIAEAAGRAESAKLAAAGEAEATKLRAAADAEKTRITGQAEGSSKESIGLGEAAAIRANLLAEADGQAQLAEARAADNEINLRQYAIGEYLAVQKVAAQAMAEAIAQIGAKISYTQIGSSNGHGNGNGNGNGMVDMLSQLPQLAAEMSAQSQALAGKDLPQVLESIASLIRTGKMLDADVTVEKDIIPGTVTTARPKMGARTTNLAVPETKKDQ